MVKYKYQTRRVRVTSYWTIALKTANYTLPEGFEGAMTVPMNGFQGEADETDLEHHWTNSVPMQSIRLCDNVVLCLDVFGKCVDLTFVILCHFLSQPPVLMVSILPSALAPIQVLSYLIQVMGRVDDMFAGMYSPTLGAQGYTNRLSRLWEQILICQILPGRLDSKRLEETYTCRCFLPFGQFGSTKTRSGSGAMVGWNYWQARHGQSEVALHSFDSEEMREEKWWHRI